MALLQIPPPLQRIKGDQERGDIGSEWETTGKKRTFQEPLGLCLTGARENERGLGTLEHTLELSELGEGKSLF